MSKFDNTIHQIVGVARRKFVGSRNVNIYPLGYQDESYHFVAFKSEDIQNVFLPQGTIFGYNFPEHLIDKLIILEVKENDDVEDLKKDKFIVDYSTKIREYEHTSVIVTTKPKLSEAIEANGYDQYYKVGGSRLFKITKTDRRKGIGKFWKLDDDFFIRNSSYVIQNENDIYIIGDDINDHMFSYGEMLDTSEIVTYISDVIVKHKVNPQSLNSIPDGLREVIGVPMKILQLRFDEYAKVLEYITFSHNQILKLASNPLLSEVLQRSIKEYEDEYIQMYELHHQSEIKKLNNENLAILKARTEELSVIEAAHNLRIEKIDVKIAEKETLLQQVMSKINNQTEEVEKQEKRFAEIESHKARLIEDFSVIRDVIGEGSTTSNKPQRLFTRAIESHNSQGSEITTRDEFVRALAAHLQNSELTRGIAENTFKLIVGRNDDEINLGVILFPTIKVVKALLRAIGQYNLLSISVAPNWSSYEDLYNNGLADIIDSAIADSNRIHILLLQNMNLSYIPSYMQPINDCLYGLSNTLPTSNGGAEYPSNLLIFGTRTKQEAISVSEEDIELYGCLENTDYYEEYEEDIEVKEGFISMSFIEQYREDLYSYSSSPESYVD